MGEAIGERFDEEGAGGMKFRYFAIFFCISGLVWQLPTNWLLFIPVAGFWILSSLVVTTVIMWILERRGSW